MSILNEKQKRIVYTIIIIILATCAITTGSMWGDEICRVEKPIYGSLQDTISQGLRYAQPGYLLYMRLWSHLVGTTEFLLRCSNIIFVIIAIYYSFKIIEVKQQDGWRLETIFVFFLHPIFIYYMDEVTPYIIVYALALAYIYHVFFVDEYDSVNNLIKINAIYLAGVFMHFMFGFIIILYLVKCLSGLRNNSTKIKRHIGVLCAFCIAYVPLLLLYITHLMSTTTGFSVKNIMYIIYGFFGMSGMGLSRNDLRAGNFNNIQVYQIIMLGIYVLILLAILFISVRKKSQFIKKNKLLVIATLIYFICMFVVGVILQFGLWERHCMVVFPVFIILMTDCIHEIMPAKFGKGIVIIYFSLLILSCINIRWNYCYSCDDYKGVTNEINDMLTDNQDIVVMASIYTDALYYTLDIKETDNQVLLDTRNMEESQIKEKFESVSKEKKVMLLLFEKHCSREFYHSFDDEQYSVNRKFNSFEIIETK